MHDCEDFWEGASQVTHDLNLFRNLARGIRSGGRKAVGQAVHGANFVRRAPTGIRKAVVPRRATVSSLSKV